MQFGTGRRGRRELVDINVTSLVDVIFNLLLFFVLTTTFQDSSGLVVDLPKAAAADVTTSPRDVVIALTREGQTVVLGKPVTPEELDETLDAFRASAPDGLVILQADEEVPHGRVVEVMDAAKKKGLSRVVIATRGE